jgi:hypothetical protein
MAVKLAFVVSDLLRSLAHAFWQAFDALSSLSFVRRQASLFYGRSASELPK